MKTKLIFTKAYARDFSIIMEEAWYYALSKGLWIKLGVKNPPSWPNFFYFNKGIIEVWENKEFIKCITDVIWGKRGDYNFFKELLVAYSVLVDELKKDELSDIAYFDTLFEAIALFSIIWYGILDDRTEKNLRKKFVDARDKDTIFDSNDKIVRKRILGKFSHLKLVETALLKEEFLNQPPAVSILKKRLDHFVLVPGEYAHIITLEEFALTYHLELEVFHKTKDYVLKGVVGNPGKAVGKARIIRMKTDMDKMKQGEVIVSPMTTPDVFPAMRKACAVVTDEGGLLCHAAIISRELNIPCVIGTKVASELYKDGDLVEVDAINGIVRKLK